MSDCRFGVSPVNYPDPDPDPGVLHHFRLVITFVLSGPISILYLVVVVSRRSTRLPASSSSSAFTIMSSAKRE